MLNLLFSILLASSSTAALSTAYWITQQIEKIDQTPIIENAASFAPAAPFAQEQPSPLADRSPFSLVYQFKRACTLENLAIRSDGHLLMTSTSHHSGEGAIHYLDPRGGDSSMLTDFPGTTSTTGIVEITKDVFIVAAGNFSTETYKGVPGSFSVWSIDFSTRKPTVKKITAIPEAAALNGLTVVEGSSDLVLISDSSLGAVWRVNTRSGEYDMAMQHVLFTNGASPFPLGINGIAIFDQYLHFINSAQRLYGRVAIDKRGSPTAEPEIIARGGPEATTWDDLAIDWEGNGWITTHPNAVTEVTLTGKQRNFTASDDRSDLKDPTSIAFGRGSQAAAKTLYVVTSGKGAPGQVIALDTRLV